jgi:gamma-D-glutamyl-L-lysine dipeptidyl-peptidase
MSYGITHLSVIPCRAEPSDKAEMVTQLLFGEVYQVLDEKPKWLLIKQAYDGYESWICRKQFLEISGTEYDEHVMNTFPMCTSFTARLSDYSLITLGSTLPYFHQNRLRIRSNELGFDGEGGFFKPDKLQTAAKLFINTPYLWGGRSLFGIDCSGFTQLIFKLIQQPIPRDAYQQAEMGIDVPFIELAECGDLAFFDNPEGRITHVGILLDNKTVIHASGKVRIDKIDHQGIYSEELREYTHQLRLIKRIL